MWWRVLTGALALGLVATALTSEPRVNDLDDRPVVIATLPCDTQLQSTSSGFVIDDSTVVTVAHAIYESRDFAIRDSWGRWHEATVDYIDLELDLAVLRVDGLRADPMRTRTAQSGEQVRMLAGAASGTTQGEVLRPVRITTEVIGDLSRESERSGYELSMPIVGGDSGAAVVDADDNLVGLVFARSTRREAAWATSVTEIDDVLNRTGGPTWSCDSESNVELELLPIAEPTKLAG